MNNIINLKEYLLGQIDIDNKNVKRLLISLSIPSILAVVVNNLNQIINSILVGKVIGEGAIAAVAIVSPFIGILITFSMMVSTGGMSILSRSLGEKNIEKAKLSDVESDYSAMKSAALSYYAEKGSLEQIKQNELLEYIAVSYTHLTLPTTILV